VTDTPLVDRLAALPTLTAVPRTEIEWLAAHAEVRRSEAGTVVFPKGQPLPGLVIILSGRATVYAERAGMTTAIRTVEAGAVTGLLPYSRLNIPAGYAMADEPLELLFVPAADLAEMTRHCYHFTALCVHEMVDRTRLFKADDLRHERLASLGRLAAGLAHELNNPSSAVASSARELDACRVELVAASAALGAAGLSDEQRAVLGVLEAAANQPGEASSPLVCADREEALGRWFEDRGVDAGAAAPLASTAVAVADLEIVAKGLTRPQLSAALRYVSANLTVARLTAEIGSAARRIHSLVDAVKKHTRLDRAPVVEATDVGDGLTETLALVGSKARARKVALELHVQPHLPTVRGVSGELNLVWRHLVDNAIDAVPESGRVDVTAVSENGAVVVRVTDNGSGIAEQDRGRIFEPFFTTKTVGQGAGLGLDVVQSVVKSHSGSIEVRSSPGRTEFQVSLPAVGAGRQ
jgi:signal transduction histidine kinase